MSDSDATVTPASFAAQSARGLSNPNVLTCQGVYLLPEPITRPGFESKAYWMTAAVTQRPRSLSEMQQQGWGRLPMAQTLGLPLAYIQRHRDDITTKEYQHIPHDIVNALSADWDFQRIQQSIRTQGHAYLAKSYVLGGCLLVRYDGKPLTVQVMKAVMRYVQCGIPEACVSRLIWTIGDLERHWAQCHPGLDPESFERFWLAFKRDRIAEGDTSYESLESPVDAAVVAHDTVSGMPRGTW